MCCFCLKWGVIPVSHICTDKLDALYIAIEMIFSLIFPNNRKYNERATNHVPQCVWLFDLEEWLSFSFL
jgi:hypothetical protein